MLKLEKPAILSPNRYHLGDLIAIFQKCLKKRNTYLYSSHICNCCGNSVQNCLQEINSLFVEKICLINVKKIDGLINPPWQNYEINHPYIKSFKAKNNQQKNYITYQFDSRSTPKRRIKTISNLEKSLLDSNQNLVHVGENDMGLIEKFNLINNSKIFIGIDSGITHLALLTNTPICVIFTEGAENNPKKFYPDTEQIKYYSNMKQLIDENL